MRKTYDYPKYAGVIYKDNVLLIVHQATFLVASASAIYFTAVNQSIYRGKLGKLPR